MALQQVLNPLTGDFDLVDVVDLTSFISKTTLTGTTTTNSLEEIGQITPATDKFTRYKLNVIGIQTAVGTEGAIDEKHAFTVEFGAHNIAGVLTISNISGVTNEEDTALFQDANTFNACTVSVVGTNVSFGITGLDGTIDWTFEVTKL